MNWNQIWNPTNEDKITQLRWMIIVMKIALVVDVILVWILPYSHSLHFYGEDGEIAIWENDPIYKKPNTITLVFFIPTILFASTLYWLQTGTIRTAMRAISMIAAGFCFFMANFIGNQDDIASWGALFFAGILPILGAWYLGEKRIQNLEFEMVKNIFEPSDSVSGKSKHPH